MQHLSDDPVQNVHCVSSLSCTFLTAPGLVVAYIANTFFMDRRPIRKAGGCPVGSEHQPASTVAAEDVPGKQGLACGIQRYCTPLFPLIGPLQHQFLRQVELVWGDDLEGLKGTGIGFSAPKDSLVERVVQDAPHTGVVPVLSLPVFDPVVVEEISKAPSAVTGRNAEIKHHPNNSGLILINDQHVHLMFALVKDAALFQPVPVWCASTAQPSFLYHLAKGRFGTHRSFLALSIGLPETDVVGQAVRVGLKPLLSFLYAPDADALFSKPLHNEGCFI